MSLVECTELANESVASVLMGSGIPSRDVKGLFLEGGGLVEKLTIPVCSASGSRKCVGENVKIVQRRKMAPLFLDLQEQICPKHISVEAKEGHYDIVFPLEQWFESFLME